jgi:hypothetical protein
VRLNDFLYKSPVPHKTLNGLYSLRATGDVLGVGPFAGVGVFSFDGDGHVAGTLVTRTNGNHGQSNVEGVYSVSPDCFANDTLTSTTGAVSTHTYAVFSRGHGYYILNTTAGAPNVIIGEARKQNPETAESRDDQ